MKKNLSYRPEIDGLRCVAVLSVIFYHFDFTFSGNRIFEGGYIGVDIFYVISGYLITSIILRGLQNKNFSLIYFYERRIRRLIPALVFVIFLTLPLAWVKLLPLELVNLFSSISFTSFFISNFYFWNAGDIYGAVSSIYEPLLHTWSLAVEEQFYIFYPFLIFIIFFFLKKNFNTYFLILFFLSLIFSQYFSLKHPTFNFYMLFGRIWELIAGALIAHNEKYLINIKIKKFHNLFCLLGIFMLGFSLLLFDKNTLHPSIITIIPVLGTVLLILFLNLNKFFKKLLSSKILVGVGIISYSLYLWHYPLYSYFIRFSSIDNNNLNKLVLVLITFLLSIFTYFFIEKPCRQKKYKFKKIFFGLIFSLLLLNSFTFVVHKNNGFDDRLELSNFQKKFINYNNFDFFEDQKKIDVNKKNLLVVGNSHAKDFYNILFLNKDLTQLYNIKILHIQISCLEEAIINNYDYCLKRLDFKSQQKFIEQFKNLKKANVIVFKTRWSKKDINSLDNLLNMEILKNKRIVIVNTSPEFSFSNNLIKIEYDFKNSLKQRLYDVSSPIDKFVILNDRLPKKNENQSLERFYFKSLKEIKDLNSMLFEKSKKLKVEYYNFYNKICFDFKKNCKVIYNDEKIYLDNTGHFTESGKKFISSNMKDFLNP